MVEQDMINSLVDRYVRDELSADEVVAFEEQLLEDPQLQDELEAVLALKETLTQQNQLDANIEEPEDLPSGGNQWSSMAIAASVLLAIVSTTFYWRTSVEAGRLQEQLTALQAPRTSVLNVAVNIMRSAGSKTPDVIIQKPAGHGVMVLDIELSTGFHKLDSINFQLQAGENESVLSWSAPPTTSGRASVVLNAEAVPDGMVYLQMSDPSGMLREKRLLEFRKPRP